MTRPIKYILCTLFFLLLVQIASAQKKYTISGYINDNANGESLIGATVKVVETKTGSATNTYGFYSIALPLGKYTLIFSYLGYKTISIPVILDKNITINQKMEAQVTEAREVVITGEREDKNVKSTEMSRMEITGQQVKSLPVIFGEPDVLKAITLLPGIKSGGEGSTSFYVRGGGPDQNLIMMDEAVVYNPSHLFGFLSVFNTDAVKNIDIIKGGMPANYGGRLSSILNVNMREGNNQKYVVNGGVGLISSRISAEGPIQKGRSSFLVAARRTYADVLARPFLSDDLKGNGYYFYDLNLKMNFNLGQKDKLFFSGYFGRDILSYQSPINKTVNFNLGWGNSTATLRWNHVFNSKLFCNTSLIYNRYDLYNNFTFGTTGFNVRSGIQDWNVKNDYTWFVSDKHQAKFGLNYTYHTFTPGILTGQAGSIILDQEIDKQYAHELAIYALDEWQIGQRFILNAGLRAVFYNMVGPYTKKQYNDENLPTGVETTWKTNESIVFYPRLEPRAALTYLLNSSSSIKASFTQTYQFIHLATTSGASFPVDLWVPSSPRVKPQLAYQYALGYYKNFNNNKWESSAEVYYKPMYNQIEFKPFSRLFLNQNLEEQMVFGQGLSYGLELFLKKKVGRTTGWIGYTLSKTTRQFDAINNGEAYFFRYDRTHDISIVISHTFNKKWSMNFVFVYGTGNAVTLPVARYPFRVGYNVQQNKPELTFIDVYGKINDYRLPAYHRADVSFTYIAKKTNKWESSWNFSIYNIYNRANPYFIYFLPDIDKQEVKAYMVYLFPILPSVAWNFKF